MLWKYNYYCPRCDHQLTNNDQIHFTVETISKQHGDLFLSTVPGEYGCNSDDSLTFSQGEKIDFFCPSCGANLLSENHPELVEINMKVSDDIVFEVFFSPVCGEQVTYVMMENELVKYRDNFFGEIEEENRIS